MKQRLILYIILFLVNISIFAQSTSQDYLLATEYYNDGEFDKAAELYKKIYDVTGSPSYFRYYLECLIKTGKVKEAVKEAKKAYRSHSRSPLFNVMLGYTYKMAGDSTKAVSVFDKLIKNIPSSPSSVINIANNLMSIRELGYAEQLYIKAQKHFKKQYSFGMELGYLYFLERKYDKMVKSYLDLLNENPDYLTTIKSRLTYTISNDDGSVTKVLKSELIRRVQKNPGNATFGDLLIWILLKQKDYETALSYAIAMDKRLKTPERVLDIGNLLMKESKYDEAIKSFKYVMKKYDASSMAYISAKTYYLQAVFKKLTENRKSSKQELLDLKNDFEKTFEAYSYNNSTFDAIKSYALLIGRYLHEPDSAVTFLKNVVDKYGRYFDGLKKEKLNLLLGDMYLISGDPWTATIIYSRLERQTISPEIRDKAKLRKAQLAFYSGQMAWAKALLDILKGSTSKPIANDAFSLAEFIANNTMNDSATEPILMYGRALYKDFCGEDSLALLTLDSIIAKYPQHDVIDDTYLLKGKIYEKLGKYKEAADAFHYVAEYYAFDILADNALFYLAQLYDKYLDNKEKAKEYYKKLIINFPESIFIPEARKRFRELIKENTPS